MWELQQRLLPRSAQSLQSGQALVLIIDGADRLVDQHGQLISDWIPKTLPRVSGRRGEGRMQQGGEGPVQHCSPPFPSTSVFLCPIIVCAPGAECVQ